MSSEDLKNSIALLYKKKGKDVLEQKDLELMITMDFRWFTPKEANTLIELALNSKLILKVKNGLKINFDWQNREIPLGFKPTSAIFDEDIHQSCFATIVDAIEQIDKIPRKDIVAEINQKQETLNVAIEIAALLVGAEHGLDITSFYDSVEKDLSDRFVQKSN
ncbi:MAG: DUF2240 family protein [Thermoplasmata archaeon]|nr:MAG: DUF2240 family protein [Thermoplasmata archaeon]